MAEVTIRLRPNGPLLIEGPFKLVDSRGAEFQIPPNKPAVALCRCGQSSKKPFCDGRTKRAASFPTKRRRRRPWDSM
ncbi:MAG TPA: CDGSH iron-sulfur domain-containing protein [Lacipirellulaceae bacterium]|nr:CDGSH iron-sulfur domain-containing protein [Lacipirellulaceae bacterium]